MGSKKTPAGNRSKCRNRPKQSAANILAPEPAGVGSGSTRRRKQQHAAKQQRVPHNSEEPSHNLNGDLNDHELPFHNFDDDLDDEVQAPDSFNDKLYNNNPQPHNLDEDINDNDLGPLNSDYELHNDDPTPDNCNEDINDDDDQEPNKSNQDTEQAKQLSHISEHNRNTHDNQVIGPSNDWTNQVVTPSDMTEILIIEASSPTIHQRPKEQAQKVIEASWV